MLMTSSRPKMMVSPSATRMTATPSTRPTSIWGARTYWKYSTAPDIIVPRELRDRTRSEARASVGADGVFPLHLSDDLELAAGDADDIHRLHRLMIAGPKGFFALRRHPFQIVERGADLVGIGALGLLDCGHVGPGY